MRSNNKKYSEMLERRIRILNFLIDNPVTSYEIEQWLKASSPKPMQNDLLFLHKCGAIEHGEKVLRNDRYRPILIFKRMMTRDEIMQISRENFVSNALARESKVPDLPHSLLVMMGYHKLGEPVGGRIVNNEHFNPSYQLRKMEINIGNHWGIMMEASQ